MCNFSLSVIVPSYKPQDYLWKCLDSLLNQTIPNDFFEIILVLNGCAEPYARDISDYIVKHPKYRIKLFQTDIGGVSNARNIGIDNACGDFIVFIDDDDYVSPKFLECLFDKRIDNGVVIADMISFKDDSGIDNSFDYHKMYLNSQIEKIYKPNSLRKFFNGPVSKLIPRSIIADRRFDNRFSNGEDSLFMFLISDRIEACVLAESDAVYFRRLRLGSATTTRKSFSYVLKNELSWIISIVKIYFGNLFYYDFPFFLTRVLGGIKVILFESRGTSIEKKSINK